jgi:CDP-paratose 2-epimerase
MTKKYFMNFQDNLGYLVWMKLPWQFCSIKNLNEYLHKDLSNSSGWLHELHLAKCMVWRTIEALKTRGVKHLRTGASWAEGETSGGFAWICWYIQEFAKAGLYVLPNINYTPYQYAMARLDEEKQKAIGDVKRQEWIEELCNRSTSCIPPLPINAGDLFVDRFLKANGHYIGDTVELWNEPNIETDWLSLLDPNLELFNQMIEGMAKVVRSHNKKVLLGGPSGLKIEWIHKLGKQGVFDHIDYMGLHGLRGTWSDNSLRPSWSERIESLKTVMKNYTSRDIPVWITEVGFPTVDLEFKISDEHLEDIQVAVFAEALEALDRGSTNRIYWYTLGDAVSPSVRFLTTKWEDILQYYFGDSDTEGNPKILAQLLMKGGTSEVLNYVSKEGISDLATEIIDRGNPKNWTMDMLLEIIGRKKQQALNRKSEDVQC